MDRCAVFVDAGYLYAEGGKLCHGTSKRRELQLDASAACDRLVGIATIACGLPPLRTYWYDGALDGIPTTAQQLVAALPNVKLRLGRINARGQQKGVDALIYRDLMTLARERAISDAYLLSGDEDLREGVKTAQDMGVRVTLLGIETSNETWNQSKDLVNEADEARVMTRDAIAAFLRKAVAPAGSAVIRDDPVTAVREAASEHAENWLKRATDEELVSLRAAQPRIPQTLDTDLLVGVELKIGASLRGHDNLHRVARRSFWERIDKST